MVIYGTGEKKRAPIDLRCECPECKEHHSVKLVVFQKYAHVFWIPFFPLGRRHVCFCDKCKIAFDKDSLPPGVGMSYAEAKQGVRTPFYMFTFCFMLAAFILFITLHIQQENKNTKAFLTVPQAGDIYEYKIDNAEYTLLKVWAVSADTVFFVHNSYSSNTASGLDQLEDKEYGEEVYYFLQPELMEKYTAGNLRKVIRK